jgi:CheY-specific phosphatase CheX
MNHHGQEHEFPEIAAEAFATGAMVALQEQLQWEFQIQPIPAAFPNPGDEFVEARIRLIRPAMGNLVLSIPEEAAAILAARYLPPGTEITKTLADDVAGELANVIAGQAKTMLKGTPWHFLLSTPAVNRVPTPNPPPERQTCYRCWRIASEAGAFILEVEFPLEPVS